VKLYGFWRSLASYRVRVALAMKGMRAEEISIDLLKGKQNEADYLAVNPQGVVPRWCSTRAARRSSSRSPSSSTWRRTHPQPALLPKDPRGRARVRGLALIAAADGHPLVTPRIRTYLEKEMKQDEAARNRWLGHWTMRALEAIEGHLSQGEGDRPLLPRRLASRSPTSASPRR
jgi:maleylacetoacetate isomerase